MKSNIWLCSVIPATTSMVSVAHADNATRVAATSQHLVGWSVPRLVNSLADKQVP